MDNAIDIIISDVMMPKMDGFELLENIKTDERFKNISMIMLTQEQQKKINCLHLHWELTITSQNPSVGKDYW